jgi:hypothetical protein
MNKYAIFIDDCEIHLDVEIGCDSLESMREEIAKEMQSGREFGHVEQYPFYLAYWEIVGSSLPVGFDKNTILELAQ